MTTAAYNEARLQEATRIPVGHLAKAIAAAIQAERDHASILLGTCPVCGCIAWERDADTGKEYCRYYKACRHPEQRSGCPATRQPCKVTPYEANRKNRGFIPKRSRRLRPVTLYGGDTGRPAPTAGRHQGAPATHQRRSNECNQ